MEHHFPYCATCRVALCIPCATGTAHREHYLLSRPTPSPCGACADAQSTLTLRASGLDETFTSAVTLALSSLQLLLLDCSQGGSHIAAHCDVMGGLPLDVAVGLQQPQGSGSGAAAASGQCCPASSGIQLPVPTASGT